MRMTKIEVDEHHGVVTIKVDGPLSAENYRAISDRVGVDIQHAGGLRGLIIQGEQFPSWRDLSEFLGNMRFIAEAQDTLVRVAAVTDTAPIDFLRSLSAYFEHAEVRHFRLNMATRAPLWAGDSAAVPDRPAAEPPDGDPADPEVVFPDQDSGIVVLEESDAAAGDDIDDWFVKN